MATAPTPQRTVILQDDALRRLQGFTQLPNVVLKHPTISYGAKVAFGVLLSYAWQDDFCWPAQDRLANDLNCSVRQVQRLLKELKDASFVDWKQQGLNKPNVYYLLPMTRWNGQKSAKHADTTDVSYPGTTEVSRPEATHPSLLEATDLSPKEDSRKKIQSNVNVAYKTTLESHRLNPAISDTALVNRYGLTAKQIDETRRLVDLQIAVLGAGNRNHAAYVKRAAEAVRDGTTHALQVAIGELTQLPQLAGLNLGFSRI